MRRRVINEFLAEINGIKVTNESLYNCLDYILGCIENNFGNCYNNLFIEELIYSIKTLWYKYEDFTYKDLESELNFEVDKFEDIRFTYCNSSSEFKRLNEGLEKGIYQLHS